MRGMIHVIFLSSPKTIGVYNILRAAIYLKTTHHDYDPAHFMIFFKLGRLQLPRWHLWAFMRNVELDYNFLRPNLLQVTVTSASITVLLPQLCKICALIPSSTHSSPLASDFPMGSLSINNEEKMGDLDTYRHAFPWPINGTSHRIQNGQAERAQAPCMVFLWKSGLGILTQQLS